MQKKLLLLTFNPGLALTGFRTTRARGPFLETSETFRAHKAIAKSQTLRLQSCKYLIRIFLI